VRVKHTKGVEHGQYRINKNPDTEKDQYGIEGGHPVTHDIGYEGDNVDHPVGYYRLVGHVSCLPDPVEYAVGNEVQDEQYVGNDKNGHRLN